MKNRLLIFIFAFLSLLSCKNENTEGKRLYKTHCMNCHQEDGQGVGKLIPRISGEFLKINSDEIPCYLKHGLNGEIEVNGVSYNHDMPKNDKLTDIDIVNILNYNDSEFASGSGNTYNVEMIKSSLESCN